MYERTLFAERQAGAQRHGQADHFSNKCFERQILFENHASALETIGWINEKSICKICRPVRPL